MNRPVTTGYFQILNEGNTGLVRLGREIQPLYLPFLSSVIEMICKGKNIIEEHHEISWLTSLVDNVSSLD